jgi:hypothetical protein
MDKDVLHFKSLNKLASKLMITVANVMLEPSGKTNARVSVANLCQQLADREMYFERIKKIILDFFNKEHDDKDYNLDEEQVDKLVEKLIKEINTVTQISLAAQDKLDMAWDDDTQDFVFKNKEDNKDVRSNDE